MTGAPVPKLHSHTRSSAVRLASPPAPTPDSIPDDENRLLTTREAAAYTPYTAHGLENLRSAGEGPAYVKICRGGAVAYRLADLIAWQQQHRFGTLDQD